MNDLLNISENAFISEKKKKRKKEKKENYVKETFTDTSCHPEEIQYSQLRNIASKRDARPRINDSPGILSSDQQQLQRKKEKYHRHQNHACHAVPASYPEHITNSYFTLFSFDLIS
jgi:hypothetical protein